MLTARKRNGPSKARPNPASLAARRVPVSTIMTKEVITAEPYLSVDSAIELMFTKGINRLPVVDEEGHLIGVFSASDFAWTKAAEGDIVESDFVRPKHGDGAYGEVRLLQAPQTVSERMAEQPLTVAPTTSIGKAAEMMAVHHLHGIPVVSGSTLVGVVSAVDIAAWLAGLRP